jgi:hypothetical protein
MLQDMGKEKASQKNAIPSSFISQKQDDNNNKGQATEQADKK